MPALKDGFQFKHINKHPMQLNVLVSLASLVAHNTYNMYLFDNVCSTLSESSNDDDVLAELSEFHDFVEERNSPFQDSPFDFPNVVNF